MAQKQGGRALRGPPWPSVTPGLHPGVPPSPDSPGNLQLAWLCFSQEPRLKAVSWSSGSENTSPADPSFLLEITRGAAFSPLSPVLGAGCGESQQAGGPVSCHSSLTRYGRESRDGRDVSSYIIRGVWQDREELSPRPPSPPQ